MKSILTGTTENHTESFKAGRKWRNDITQPPDCTDEETELRKATEGDKHDSGGPGTWIQGLDSYHSVQVTLEEFGTCES